MLELQEYYQNLQFRLEMFLENSRLPKIIPN